MYSQLPGYVTTKKPNATGWLLVLALFSAAGFVTLRYAPTFSKDTRTETPSPPALNASMGDTEDLRVRLHLDHAVAAQKQAAAALERSHIWLERALPSLDDRPLAVRRLELARSAGKSAEAQINRAQEELDIAKTILTERSIDNNEPSATRK